MDRSLIFFSAAILSFVWTSGSDHDAVNPPKNSVELDPRIIISAIFGIGVLYLILVIYSFSSYVYNDNEEATLEEIDADANYYHENYGYPPPPQNITGVSAYTY